VAKKNVNSPESLRRFNRNACILGTLWFAVMASGIGVVYSNHLSRQLFSELESKRRTASDLHVEWGQYLLEQSTWAAYSRVEQIAAEKLEMQTPAQQQIVIIRQP
jgi:cell division protein FtsL